MGKAPIPVHSQFTDAQKLSVVGWYESGKTQQQIADLLGVPRRTIMKLCEHLGLSRSVKEVAKISAPVDDPDLVEKIRELRPTHSLPELSKLLGKPISTIHRLCQRNNIGVPDNLSELQSARMKAAWTDEKKQIAAVNANALVTPELRERLADGSCKLWENEEYRANQVSTQRMIWSDLSLCKKMSEVLTQYWDNNERRVAMAAIQQLVWTDVKRSEMSEIQKRIWDDPERKKKLSEICKIVWADPGLRRADSDRMKKIWESKELRSADSTRMKEVWKNQDLLGSHSKKMKELWKDEKYRATQSEIIKKRWEDPAYRDHMATKRAEQPKVSSIQTALYAMLDDLNVPYYREYQDRPADVECVIGPYNFDCVVPRLGLKSLLIECHGDYWHGLERTIRVDKSKATYVNNYYSKTHELKYIWEHEFHCQGRVLETLKYWLGMADVEVIDFDFQDVVIKPALAVDYKPLLLKYHYLSNAGRGGIPFGAYLGDELIAVCIFSPPIRQNVNVGDVNRADVVELSRLCVHPKYQKKNLSSWFVSKCLKALDPKYKMIISYCDTTFNHDGATYKALNFIKDRVIRADYWYTSQDGWVMHKKTLYDRAVRMTMKESEYAEKFGYIRVFGSNKLRFIYKR